MGSPFEGLRGECDVPAFCTVVELILPVGVAAKAGRVSAVAREAELLSAEAVAARDALAESLVPLKGRAPATVTAGYNVKTGEVAARACDGGKCAEDVVVKALGGNKADVRFVKAVRPRTGEQVPVCVHCEASYGRNVFKSVTKFKSDE
jgi:hypothetical protein